ncbi:MAG: phosphodiester glycosidase family protein [Acidobacteria bacterium]|nr:phosphodiester glycosidase family protein [Acidobacteriota bacterium]
MRWGFFLVAFGVFLHAAETVHHPFPGVTHFIRTDTTPRNHVMHVVKIDLATRGLRFKVSPRGGTREAVRQTTLEFLLAERAQVAVNLHFFLPFPSSDPNSNLVGLAASEGIVYSDFEIPEQSYALVANAPALNIDRQNQASIVTPAEAQSAALWNTFAGSAQIVTNGEVTIPAYRDEQHPAGLLTPGGPKQYSNAKSWYAEPNARTIAGLSRDNRVLFLVTIDKSAASEGLSLFEAAEILIRDLAVHNALNLDGGGSTTLAMENPLTHERTLVNMPSGGGKARSVASSLAVFVPLDTTAPVTAHSFSSGSGSGGSFARNLTIELQASDDAAGTGVEQIYFSIAAEQPATILSQQPQRAVIHLSSPGVYEIRFFARDHAGNTETPQALSIRIAP